MPLSCLVFLAVWYFYSTLTGLLTVYYDVRTHKFVATKYLRVYSAVMQACMLLSLPFFLYHGMEGGFLSKTNPLTRYTRAVTVVVQAVENLYTIASCRRRERCTLAILRALQRMEAGCFERTLAVRDPELSSPQGRRLRFITAAYIAVNVALALLGLLVNVRAIMASGEWQYFATLYISLNTVNMIQGVRLHFFIIVAHICRRTILLNAQLERLLSGREHRSVVGLTLQMWTLHATRAQLARLLAMLCESYKWQIVFKLFVDFIQLVTIGYYGIVLINQHLFNARSFVTGTFEYCFMLFNLYEFNAMGELTANCCRQTADIMRGSLLLRRQAVPQRQLALQRSCEWFTLSLTGPVMEVNAFGVFVINRRQIFNVTAQIILYTIFLVQDDYRNIYKASSAAPTR